MSEIKQAPPASVRNMPPLREVIVRALAPTAVPKGRVLEVASGSGYHAAAFAAALPHLTWQPTDPDADARASIAAYVADTALPNLEKPLELDVRATSWPVSDAAAMVCINMIHISPWAATEGLLAGAGRTLIPQGRLITYGPYVIDGDFQAESNVAFDQSLRTRNAEWGIRDVKDIVPLAAANGLALIERLPMPANNHTLIFQKA